MPADAEPFASVVCAEPISLATTPAAVFEAIACAEEEAEALAVAVLPEPSRAMERLARPGLPAVPFLTLFESLALPAEAVVP